jgi:hypothetical protein
MMGWTCVQSGRPGLWLPFGDVGDTIGKSYFSGVIDITRVSGIIPTGENIGGRLQAIVNNISDNSTLRFPPGKYYLDRTIHFNQKKNIDVLCQGAKFYETSDRIWANSGAFYFNFCTGINWYGGSLSGAANLNFILSVASGIEMSGLGFENLALDSFDTRNLVPCTFNLDQCADMMFDNFDVYDKYRYAALYRCLNTSFTNITYQGVHTGSLNRGSSELLAVGTGFATRGNIEKEACRHAYAFFNIKGRDIIIDNVHTKNCGGFLVAGSSSYAGGQGPTLPEMITIGNSSARNSYDNHIYLSSVDKAQVSNFMAINDSGIPHSIDGIKARGRYITFNNCYVEHAYHAFGFEAGISTYNDYWNSGGIGWSSHGCQLINCRAVDIAAHGFFADVNDDDTSFPRDILIQGNYFYNCYLGPAGRIPTGYVVGENIQNSVICATDAYRIKIVDNVIENTGSYGPDQGIFVGRYRRSAEQMITGVEIRDNKFLGCKAGIHLLDVDYARVSNNYGERIGQYGVPYVIFTGTPALIRCEGVTNSRFVDNFMVPTGHAFCLTVVPGTTFENNTIRDNDGVIDIN